METTQTNKTILDCVIGGSFRSCLLVHPNDETLKRIAGYPTIDTESAVDYHAWLYEYRDEPIIVVKQAVTLYQKWRHLARFWDSLCKEPVAYSRAARKGVPQRFPVQARFILVAERDTPLTQRIAERVHRDRQA